MKKTTALLVLALILCGFSPALAEQREAISTPDAPSPTPLDNPAYSQAIKYGHLVFLSGQLPIEPVTGTIPDGIVAQTRQVMDNLQAVLAAAGLKFDDVLMVTVYLANISDFAAFNNEYITGGYFSIPRPARATVAVGIPRTGVLVEISMIAGK